MSGGQGADRFIIQNAAGSVIVLDFNGLEGDKLDLSAFGFADFPALSDLVTAEGPGGHDSRIAINDDLFVILEGIAPSELSALHVIL